MKKIFSRRRMFVGLVVGLPLFICVPAAKPASSYEIVKFRCDDKREVGQEDRIKVIIQNNASTDPGAVLTVVGMQGDTMIRLTPEDGLVIFDEPGEGKTKKTFLYFPISSGVITWHATIDSDEAFCTTVVVAKEDDGDDGTKLPKNITAAHDRSSPQYKKGCRECHADILTRQSLDPSRAPAAHVSMFPYAAGKPGDDKQCVWCHRTVDLEQGTHAEGKSKGNLRRHVDVTLCALCHGSSGRATQFYQAGPSPTEPDGPALYELVCAACHRDLANSKVRGKGTEHIQRAIDHNKGGMRPLSVLSMEEIQAIADALVR